MMPGMDGLDCCRLIKGIDADTFLPVVLLTARSDTDSRVAGLRIGADDYVCKPFDERELLARVQNLLRLKRLHDQINEAKERLATLAIQDELTGLYNYRYLQTRLTRRIQARGALPRAAVVRDDRRRSFQAHQRQLWARRR